MNLSRDFVALDIETANETRSSICQIAIAVVEGGEITLVKDWYIKPKDCRFSPMNSYLHNITVTTVANSPEFNSVWDELYPLLQSKLVVAHNASFDIYALKAALELYQIESVNFSYYCTLSEAKRRYSFPKYSLPVLCKSLEIEFTGHHNAKHDAVACAKLALKMGFTKPANIYPDDLYPSFSSDSSSGFARPALRKADLTGISIFDLSEVVTPEMFKGKGIVVTGQFSRITRAEAEAYVISLGAIIRSSISARTSLVIMGTDAGPSKIDLVKEINKTQFLPIIDENEFIEVLEALAIR